MEEIDKLDAKNYHKPKLVFYGEIKAITRTNRGGSGNDGGSPPNWKGTPVTGGGFNMDPSYFDDSAESGANQEGDVFGG
jgi:hypothetical protein